MTRSTYARTPMKVKRQVRTNDFTNMGYEIKADVEHSNSYSDMTTHREGELGIHAKKYRSRRVGHG
jgi:hypothetical protein